MPEVSEEVVPEEGTPDAAPTEAIALPDQTDFAAPKQADSSETTRPTDEAPKAPDVAEASVEPSAGVTAPEVDVTGADVAEAAVVEAVDVEAEAAVVAAPEPELAEAAVVAAPESAPAEAADLVEAEVAAAESPDDSAEPVAGLPADPKIGASASPDAAVPEPIRPPSDSGKIVGGLITAISADEVCLTIDDGRAAVINGRNFDEHNTDPTTVYNVGDRIEGAILTREDPKKRVVLSRSWALKKTAWERVAKAAAANELLTGKVTATSKRGVVVDVGVRGFVPSSHIALENVSNMSSFVGQTLEFKVLEVDMAKERLVLSRRSILLKEQRKGVHDLLIGLEVGAKRTGVVSSLTDYGAFVDLGGVNGLVHLSEMSWQRVDRPSDALAVGQEVEVKVLDVKVKKRRVSLSIRQLTSDPLAAVVVDSLIEGPVTRLVDFGAFVDLGGVEGLVHLSELAEYRVSTPEEIVFPGEIIRAKVLSVDKKRRRIELSIRQAVSGDFG